MKKCYSEDKQQRVTRCLTLGAAPLALRYKFNIINLMKEDSLYSLGMQPLVHSIKVETTTVSAAAGSALAHKCVLGLPLVLVPGQQCLQQASPATSAAMQHILLRATS